MKKYSWLIFLLSFQLSSLNAQSPYQLSWKKETPFIAIGLSSLGAGIYQRGQTTTYTLEDLALLNANDINSFDRNATQHYSLSAHHASDVFWYGSASLPLLFLTNKKTRPHFGQIAALWSEALVINSGLTLLTKYTVRRTRPFAYNEEAPLDKKLATNAKASFFSGHTSITAANTFFVAKVYADFFPKSPWKPVIWGAAITIPAITGYLRVKGGRHFPTDVIAGYAVGAAVGILVPHLHKKKSKKVTGLSFIRGLNGGVIRYQF